MDAIIVNRVDTSLQSIDSRQSQQSIHMSAQNGTERMSGGKEPPLYPQQNSTQGYIPHVTRLCDSLVLPLHVSVAQGSVQQFRTVPRKMACIFE